jgi:hypothetical protein
MVSQRNRKSPATLIRVCANRAAHRPIASAIKFLSYTFIFCPKNVSKFQEGKDYKWQANKKKKMKNVRNFTSYVRLIVRESVISEIMNYL